MGTKSLTMIDAIASIPPAPRPQKALAKMKLSMEVAAAHHIVPRKKTTIVNK